MAHKDKDYKQEQQETQAEAQDIPSIQESVQGLGDSEQNLHAPAKKVNLPLPTVGKDSAQYNPLSLYLREVNRFPTLEENEEFELGRRIRDHGDKDAAFRLATSHLRLVVKIAMEFQRKWMKNVLELIQEGNIGLMKAVQKFNPEKGIKFSYYASFWIKAYILKFIMDNWRMVKIGTTQSQRKLFYNLGKEKQRLESQGFNADAETLSQNLDVSSADINEMTQRMSQGDLSLDSPFGEDSNTTRLDLLPALEASIEDRLAQEEISEKLRENINSILPQLNEKEKDILYSRLLASSPITLREIGDKYGITRERVRQIESRLLQKIKEHLSSRIKDFSSEWISHE
ncbi:MAG: sigma-70 family RNA polymerase sigma factor [Thermodesulfobacteriota bacterium]